MVLKKLVDTASIENTISIKIGSLNSSFIYNKLEIIKILRNNRLMAKQTIS